MGEVSVCPLRQAQVSGPAAAASIVTRLFDRFAVGDVNIKALANEMRAKVAEVRGQDACLACRCGLI